MYTYTLYFVERADWRLE